MQYENRKNSDCHQKIWQSYPFLIKINKKSDHKMTNIMSTSDLTELSPPLAVTAFPSDHWRGGSPMTGPQGVLMAAASAPVPVLISTDVSSGTLCTFGIFGSVDLGVVVEVVVVVVVVVVVGLVGFRNFGCSGSVGRSIGRSSRPEGRAETGEREASL